MSLRPKKNQLEAHLSMTEVKGILQASSESHNISKIENSTLLKELERRGLLNEKINGTS